VFGGGKGQATVGSLPNYQDFDLIIIAGPVWNYTIALPLTAFMNASDFSGKKVAPLQTANSNFGKVMGDFEKLVGERNGQYVARDGFADVKGKTAEALSGLVREWLAAFPPIEWNRHPPCIGPPSARQPSSGRPRPA
jgi:hypothetical protein